MFIFFSPSLLAFNSLCYITYIAAEFIITVIDPVFLESYFSGVVKSLIEMNTIVSGG